MNVCNAVRVLGCIAILVVCGACDGMRTDYAHVIKYGNLEFSGSRQFEGMSITSKPLPDDVDVLLEDGKRIHIAEITRDRMAALFGDPKLSLDDSNFGGKVEHFGDLRCTIAFKNDEFESIAVFDTVKVIKLPENAVVSFPATQSDIERVFGKPTSVAWEKFQRNAP